MPELLVLASVYTVYIVLCTMYRSVNRHLSHLNGIKTEEQLNTKLFEQILRSKTSIFDEICKDIGVLKHEQISSNTLNKRHVNKDLLCFWLESVCSFFFFFFRGGAHSTLLGEQKGYVRLVANVSWSSFGCRIVLKLPWRGVRTVRTTKGQLRPWWNSAFPEESCHVSRSSGDTSEPIEVSAAGAACWCLHYYSRVSPQLVAN